MLWVGVSSLTCSPRVWLSLVGQHESHGRDFANLDIVNTKSCQNPRIPVKIPPRNESTKSVSADRFFFLLHLLFWKNYNSLWFAIRCSRFKAGIQDAGLFKFGDLKFGPSLFHVKKPRFPRKNTIPKFRSIPSGPFLGFL